jgi:hypothetical protein
MLHDPRDCVNTCRWSAELEIEALMMRVKKKTVFIRGLPRYGKLQVLCAGQPSLSRLIASSAPMLL